MKKIILILEASILFLLTSCTINLDDNLLKMPDSFKSFDVRLRNDESYIEIDINSIFGSVICQFYPEIKLSFYYYDLITNEISQFEMDFDTFAQCETIQTYLNDLLDQSEYIYTDANSIYVHLPLQYIEQFTLDEQGNVSLYFYKNSIAHTYKLDKTSYDDILYNRSKVIDKPLSKEYTNDLMSLAYYNSRYRINHNEKVLECSVYNFRVAYTVYDDFKFVELEMNFLKDNIIIYSETIKIENLISGYTYEFNLKGYPNVIDISSCVVNESYGEFK